MNNYALVPAQHPETPQFTIFRVLSEIFACTKELCPLILMTFKIALKITLVFLDFFGEKNFFG